MEDHSPPLIVYCVVPETIHTPPMEGHWKLLGRGGSACPGVGNRTSSEKKSQGGAGGMTKARIEPFTSPDPSYVYLPIQCSKMDV